MQLARAGSSRTFAAIAVLTIALAACAPRAVKGQSQVVDGLKFDYGLVAEPAAGAPPASHPDASMHGGPPAQPNSYHVVLSVADAKTGQKIDASNVAMGLSGPGHPGTNIAPMEAMMVNGQASYGHYVVLPEPGSYEFEFRVTPSGKHQPVKARFILDRPA
ncbi:hypothetical protein [Phenylobacterium soli]|uniref:YtkA-like domain-containing protein n=1 Tax=Phenylobacterium soli TaxID=2170551 RepID=A0A328AHW1_9CAUL|nr:hypothetical protein [Phenylobacterium soli]RAK54107.1 hypothetical protein DJ017_06015 [Phenylobacterium soli]